jgi:N-glycosylase/DNA lyase
LNQTSIRGLESTIQVIAKDVQNSVDPIFTPRAESTLRRELICCILSSQVPYDLAVSATDGLVQSGLAEENFLLRRVDVERAVLDVLVKPLNTVNGRRRYRFPNKRAHDIAAAFALFRLCHGSITRFLEEYPDPAEARVWLVKRIPGLGPKQASMFLRNAGHSRDLAILDRHILKYMRLIQISDLAGGVSRIGDYEREERRFAAHAASLGFPVGILDWAVWIVLRAVAQLEGAVGW